MAYVGPSLSQTPHLNNALHHPLLLLCLLCTGVRAQNFTVTASIGLADDYGTRPNPATDCINVPDGTDMLTYLPGQNGDIIITHRATN